MIPTATNLTLLGQPIITMDKQEVGATTTDTIVQLKIAVLAWQDSAAVAA
jgi:hypothetical protein